MIKIRRSTERGHFNHGWLDTFHTFSFGEYQDSAHMNFRVLRVLNEDVVQPGRGFGSHPHQNMEIITVVLSGALEHGDNLGNGSVIRPGDIQRMTAGSGIMHSEFNPSQDEIVHLLQIWILPARTGLAPGYEQKSFAPEEKRSRFRLIASPDGSEGSVSLNQDTRLYLSLLARDEEIAFELPVGRYGWVQVASGAVTLNGDHLVAGDGAAVSEEHTLELTGQLEAELLLIDLP
jgi:redox-sensitive bicupin YhaK (pirin superfamily)